MATDVPVYVAAGLTTVVAGVSGFPASWHVLILAFALVALQRWSTG